MHIYAASRSLASEISVIGLFVILLLEGGATANSIKTVGGSEKMLSSLVDIVFQQMKASAIFRWMILRTAVVNGDRTLIDSVLTSPKLEQLPYVINPFFTQDHACNYCQGNREFNPEGQRALHSDDYKDYYRHLLQTESSLLHLAVQQKNKKFPIVKALLEYNPSDVDVRAALANEQKPAERRPSISQTSTPAIRPQMRKVKTTDATAPIENDDHDIDMLMREDIGIDSIHQPLKKHYKGDVNHIDETGRTTLHIATDCAQITTSNIRIVSALIKKKINVPRADYRGCTALHYAAYHNQVELVKMLLEVEVNPDKQISIESADARTRATLLSHHATSMTRSVQQQQQQEEKKLLFDTIAPAAHAAAAVLSMTTVIPNMGGMNIDVKEDESSLEAAAKYERSALHIAAAKGHWQVVSMLVKSTSKLNLLDKKGFTPLTLALAAKQEKNVEAGLMRRQSVVAPPDSSNCNCNCLSWCFSCCRRSNVSSSSSVTLNSPDAQSTTSNNTNRVQFASEVRVAIGGDKIELQRMNSANSGGNEQQHELLETIQNYDITIQALLNAGANIVTAARSSAKTLDELIDVEETWSTIRRKVDYLKDREDKYYADVVHMDEKQRQLNRKELLVVDQQKNELFGNKLNQIIIDHRYRKKIRDKHYVRLFFYICFLMLITTLGVYESTRDDKTAHFLNSGLINSLATDNINYGVSPIPKNFAGINSKSDFWLWMKGLFVDVMYPNPSPGYWQGGNFIPRGDGYILDHIRIIGVPRLRQQRSKVMSCDTHGQFDSLTPICMGGYDTSSFTNQNYAFSSENDIDGAWTWGSAARKYDGNGFVEFLPLPSANNNDDALAKINQLMNISWVDARTRVVFLEFVALNSNENQFVYATMMVEFPLVGGAIPSWDFAVVKLHKYVTQSDYAVLGLEWIVIVSMVLYASREFTQMKSVNVINYFSSYYNVLDLLIILIFFACLAIHASCIAMANDVNWLTTAFPNKTLMIARWATTQSALYSFMVLLVWFKLLDYLSVIKKISRLIVMAEMMLRQLLSFMILLLIVLSAFASAQFISYGYQSDSAYTWIYSILILFSSMFGGADIGPTLSFNPPILGTVYATVFLIFTTLLLLNLIIAIMNSAYEDALTESGETYWAKRQYGFLSRDEKAPLDPASQLLTDQLIAFSSMVIRNFRLLRERCQSVTSSTFND